MLHRGHYILAQFFLLFGDFSLYLLAVVAQIQLGVIVKRDHNNVVAVRLVVRVVKLGHLGVLEGLFRGQALVGVELQQAAQEVQRDVGGSVENLVERLGLGVGQRVKHCAGQLALDRVNVFLRGAPRERQDAV